MVDCRAVITKHPAWKYGFYISLFIVCISCQQIKAERRYLGCFQNDPSGWIFAWGPPKMANYTAPDCVAECEKNGFEKAGLMNGSLCRCSSMPVSMFTSSQSCNIQCVDRWDAICGGSNALSVYNTGVKADDNQYIGCWKRSGGPVFKEGLPIAWGTDTRLTSCIIDCRKQSYGDFQENLVVGVNETHCVCGSAISDSSKTEDIAKCQEGCGGQVNQPCPPDVQMLSIYTADCPEDTFGMYCSSCNCHGNDKCNKTTGKCPAGCAAGWLADPIACSKACDPHTFGNGCSYDCHCAGLESCDPVTGSCPSQACAPGYVGPTCSQACEYGTFGTDCAEICNCLNGTDCDHVNGTCPLGMCPLGWQGASCQIKTVMAPTQSKEFEPEVLTSSWTSHAAGGSAGGVLFVTLVVLIAVACYIRYRRNHNRKMKAYEARMKYLRDNSVTSLLNDTPQQSARDHPDNSFHSIPSSGGSPGMMTASPGSPGKPYRFCLTAAEFVQYYQQRQLGNEALATEFSMLKRGQLHSWTAAASNPNRKRYNRLANILPFDHNRVILREDEKENDYINASYIQSYDGTVSFIATQGPTQDTVCNFWKMIWYCDVKYIIMLTKLIESGRSKCIRYWPAIEGVSAAYEDGLSVTMTREDHWPDFVIRRFIITKGSGKREVTHYQFVGWPDMGVPKYTMPFIVFMQLVRSHRNASSDRSVVHCSTGTGRSGIFLAIDFLLDQLLKHGELDVPTCVQQLREQRINMVQTLDQYSYIYLIMYESLTLGETRIPAHDFIDRYAELKDDYPGIIEKQYQIFEQLENAAKNGDTSGNLNDSGRGSVSDFLTVSETRPISASSNHSLSFSQYVPVHGYYSKNAFLISRFPGLNDPQEFWATVHDNYSRIIVSFANTNCCWPSIKDNMEIYGPFIVTCIGANTVKSHLTKIHHIVLELDSREIVDAKRFIDVYQANIDGPLSLDIMELHCHLQDATALTRSTTPVVIHNSSNYQIAGVLCTLNVISEMLDLEKEVDIFLAVQRVRAAVPFFIDTVDIYKHLHDVTAAYISRS